MQSHHPANAASIGIAIPPNTCRVSAEFPEFPRSDLSIAVPSFVAHTVAINSSFTALDFCCYFVNTDFVNEPNTRWIGNRIPTGGIVVPPGATQCARLESATIAATLEAIKRIGEQALGSRLGIRTRVLLLPPHLCTRAPLRATRSVATKSTLWSFHQDGVKRWSRQMCKSFKGVQWSECIGVESHIVRGGYLWTL